MYGNRYWKSLMDNFENCNDAHRMTTSFDAIA